MAESHKTVLIPESLWEGFVDVLAEDRYWQLSEPLGNVFVLRQLSEDDYLGGVGVFAYEPEHSIAEPLGVGYLGEFIDDAPAPDDEPDS